MGVLGGSQPAPVAGVGMMAPELQGREGAPAPSQHAPLLV